MLGPISLVLVLAALYDQYGSLAAVQGVLRGISAVGVGLIAATGFKMMRDEFRYPLMFIVVAFTFVAATVFHLALGWVVVIALPLGLWLAWRKVKQP